MKTTHQRLIRLFFTLLFITSFLGILSARADTVVYSNSDGSTGTFSAGVTGNVSGGQQSMSPSGELFREVPLGNATFMVTIGGLAPDSAVTLDVDLYAIQSLDGNGPSGSNSPDNPDLFTITANDTTLLNASFANYSGSSGQTYPSMYTGPTDIVNNPPGTGSAVENTLGYTFSNSLGDATYALSYSASADDSGSVTLVFTGGQNQEAGDESFGLDNITVSGTLAAQPLQLTDSVSRKVQGSAGTFDIELPQDGSGIECRQSGHTEQFVFTFNNDITSANATLMTQKNGSISGDPVISGNTVTVNLTGVTDEQVVTVTLSGVTDIYAQTLPDTSVSANILVADVNGDAAVTKDDLAAVKAQVGAAVTTSNFRDDINANGSITGEDVKLVRTHRNTSIQ